MCERMSDKEREEKEEETAFQAFWQSAGSSSGCTALLQLCVRKRISLKPLLILDGNSRLEPSNPAPSSRFQSNVLVKVEESGEDNTSYIPTRHSAERCCVNLGEILHKSSRNIVAVRLRIPARACVVGLSSKLHCCILTE
jgi:hypothetical protein